MIYLRRYTVMPYTLYDLSFSLLPFHANVCIRLSGCSRRRDVRSPNQTTRISLTTERLQDIRLPSRLQQIGYTSRDQWMRLVQRSGNLKSNFESSAGHVGGSGNEGCLPKKGFPPARATTAELHVSTTTSRVTTCSTEDGEVVASKGGNGRAWWKKLTWPCRSGRRKGRYM